MTLEVDIAHPFPSVDLSVAFSAAGGITALFGRSGAGKSSVVHAIAGLLSPRHGRISVDGRTLYDAARGIDVPVHRRRMGTVFQDGRLFPHMSVAGNLSFARRFARRSPRLGEAQVVELLGLERLLPRRPATLSGGEKQRVAIGRALLSDPALLLLDEPLAALDEARKAEILPFLERLREEAGVPMVYVSHDVREVARLADRVVLMREGVAVRVGPVREVFADVEAVAMMGPRDAGSVLEGRIAAHDADDALTEVALSAGSIVLPTIAAPLGAEVRLRVRAGDVIVSLAPPEGLSTRNVMRALVLRVYEGEGPGALVELDCGGDRLLARLTRRSARSLGLAPGLACYAILKAIAVAPEDVAVTAAPSHGARPPARW